MGPVAGANEGKKENGSGKEREIEMGEGRQLQEGNKGEH